MILEGFNGWFGGGGVCGVVLARIIFVIFFGGDCHGELVM